MRYGYHTVNVAAKCITHLAAGCAVQVELRRYQQEGINWLCFLRRFGLNGVLADDMGLGKTLQATTIMACSAAERQAAAAAGTAASAAVGAAAENGGQQHDQQQQALAGRKAAAAPGGLLPSLVVCPSTLVGHWAHEINKYVDESVLHPLAISGTPAERIAAQQQLRQGAAAAGGCYNVVIISYESLRSDADWASGISWDYIVLDEGHVIRSTKSKLAQAVKRLQAQHRLVLSGTPIQNSALELWSLFDFLMPGFLGGERNAGTAVRAWRYWRSWKLMCDQLRMAAVADCAMLCRYQSHMHAASLLHPPGICCCCCCHSCS
jgi:TATA-binding protein-associated factor